jgi:hypothetical protein
MNENELRQLVRKNLDAGLRSIPTETLARLDRAREAALSRQAASARPLALAGNLELATGLWPFRPRVFGAIALLAIVLAATAFGHAQRHVSQIQRLDSAILTGDLPLEAYLSKDFDQWLRSGGRF